MIGGELLTSDWSAAGRPDHAADRARPLHRVRPHQRRLRGSRSRQAAGRAGRPRAAQVRVEN